ncbi:MAG: chemotaxis protein CheC [Nitrospirae bacterium]|nr:chemotaxis protein CheC [Nitrospirota bacterium]
MNDSNDVILDDLEIDTFKEIMNIAFGSAAASLSDIINVYVVLSVPNVKIMKSAEIADYIKSEAKACGYNNLVEQSFIGNYRGVALSIFPCGSERELLSIFNPDKESYIESDPLNELEMEILKEVGNILIGSCVGKMVELLKESVTFSPPRFIRGDILQNISLGDAFDSDHWAIIMKTVFHFEEKNISSYLFLINSHEVTASLKKALRNFWKEYE